jgi:periplasmic divalent cation tolerance protein
MGGKHMSQNDDDFIVVFCTAVQGEAEGVARALVEEQLAACVNILPVRSCYVWEGKQICDDEALLVIKTAVSQFEPLRKRILELHSYAVPEIIALPIIRGHQPYLDWMAQSIG